MLNLLMEVPGLLKVRIVATRIEKTRLTLHGEQGRLLALDREEA